jgi:hypothetical protein
MRRRVLVTVAALATLLAVVGAARASNSNSRGVVRHDAPARVTKAGTARHAPRLVVFATRARSKPANKAGAHQRQTGSDETASDDLADTQDEQSQSDDETPSQDDQGESQDDQGDWQDERESQDDEGQSSDSGGSHHEQGGSGEGDQQDD